MSQSVFATLSLDHVTLSVANAADTAAALSDAYGFTSTTRPDAVLDPSADTRSVLLRSDRIRLVLNQPTTDDHAGQAYLQAHGDGVSDIALGVDDVAAAYAEALRRGARPIAEPVRAADGGVTAAIAGFGDVVHTLVQRQPEGTGAATGTGTGIDLREIDHFAVCLEVGTLDATVAFYRSVLDFEVIFEERIVVGAQAMNSKVVRNRGGGVTLTLIEPDPSRHAGQIDDFLKNHGGPGVQHIALSTPDVVATVSELVARGVEMLPTPNSYYDLLPQRLDLTEHSVDELRELNILVDQDHGGQLFQIFTRSTHPRRTLFFEIIERHGATTFGSGNITALYRAVELDEARGRAH